MRDYSRRVALTFARFALGLILAVLFSHCASATNNTVDATLYPGSDPCAQVNAALAALPPSGGTVDASGFTAARLSIPCEVTISVNIPATIIFGYGTWTLNANPGINIAAGKVTIECPQSSEGDLYNTYPPNLVSGGSYPLISDTVQSFHGTDGFTMHNCYLQGNGIGTFGLFFPYGNAGKLYNIFTGGFTSVGQFTIGGQWIAESAYSSGNLGDGVVWGYDGSVYGNPQYAGNNGSGFHVVVGGSTLRNQGTYHNRLHGVYIDGTGDRPWAASTTYVQQRFIRPSEANPGNFAYFTQTVGTTSATPPIFCQSPGCTVSDGSVTWINVGTALGYANESVFNDSAWTELDATACADSGYLEPDGFIADNIRVEGTTANPVKFTIISDANCHQSEAGDFNANGVHLVNVNYVNITGLAWLGSGFSNNPGGSGLLLEGAKGVVLASMASWFSYSNAIKIVDSSNSTFTGIVAVNTGVASTPQPDTYAVSIDSDSVAITLDDLTVRDDRTPPFSSGIFDAGTGTIVGDYHGFNLVSDPPAGGQHRVIHGRPLNRPLDIVQGAGSASDGALRPLLTIDGGLTAAPETKSQTSRVSVTADSPSATVDCSLKQETTDDESCGTDTGGDRGGTRQAAVDPL